jgi:hypothetical protein
MSQRIMARFEDEDTAKHDNCLAEPVKRQAFAARGAWAMQWAMYATRRMEHAFTEALEAALGMAFEDESGKTLPPGALASISFTLHERGAVIELRSLMPELAGKEIVVKLHCDTKGTVQPLPKR